MASTDNQSSDMGRVEHQSSDIGINDKQNMERKEKEQRHRGKIPAGRRHEEKRALEERRGDKRPAAERTCVKAFDDNRIGRVFSSESDIIWRNVHQRCRRRFDGHRHDDIWWEVVGAEKDTRRHMRAGKNGRLIC